MGKVFTDIFTGNFSAIPADFAADVAKLPTWAQNLVTTLETDEGQILNNLVEAGATDLLTKGLTTANFTATAKDIEAQLVTQEINLGTQTVYSALNGAVAAKAPPPAAKTTGTGTGG